MNTIVGARLTQWLTRSKSLSRESLHPPEAAENQLSQSDPGQVSWFSDRDSTFLPTTADEKNHFRVSAVAKEIGLGELLDQKLGITHHPVEGKGAAGVVDVKVVGGLEGKIEKSCGVQRSRSATESTFVGTERGASLDLKRLLTEEKNVDAAGGMGMGMETMTVGMAM